MKITATCSKPTQIQENSLGVCSLRFASISMQQDRQCTYDGTLRRIRTLVAVENK